MGASLFIRGGPRVREMQLSIMGNAAIDQTRVVLKIKELCLAAHESAIRVATGQLGKSGLDNDSQRYARSLIETIQLADTLDNEFFRSAALQPIIELCMKGGDVDHARALLKHVKITFIRNKMIDAFPALLAAALATSLREVS